MAQPDLWAPICQHVGLSRRVHSLIPARFGLVTLTKLKLLQALETKAKPFILS